MTIKKGETVGIIGQSGSGKSTLLDIILGLLPLEKDKNISIFGNKLNTSAQSWQKEIGYVSQNIYLTDDTIKKNIALGIEENLIDKEKLFKSIELSQLEDFINKLENGVNSVVGERGGKISGGEKQRIGIARALYFEPEILFLDEPTSSLDSETSNIILKILNELSKETTIVMVSHKESLDSANKINIKLSDGNLIFEQ